MTLLFQSKTGEWNDFTISSIHHDIATIVNIVRRELRNPAPNIVAELKARDIEAEISYGPFYEVDEVIIC